VNQRIVNQRRAEAADVCVTAQYLRSLGLSVPPRLMLAADEMIE